MKNLYELDEYRDTSQAVINYFGHIGNHKVGSFWILSPTDHALMRVIASSGMGWEHVSVSRKTRCPNWPEMEHVKRLFFKDDETAMQLHVPVDTHIDHHSFCLHIWRPIEEEIPMPPAELVGPTKDKSK